MIQVVVIDGETQQYARFSRYSRYLLASLRAAGADPDVDHDVPPYVWDTGRQMAFREYSPRELRRVVLSAGTLGWDASYGIIFRGEEAFFVRRTWPVPRGGEVPATPTPPEPVEQLPCGCDRADCPRPHPDGSGAGRG